MSKIGTSAGLIVLLAISVVFGAMAVEASGIDLAQSSSTNGPRDFSLSVSPQSFSIQRGGNATATVFLVGIGQFSGAISLSVTTSPAISVKPTASLSPTTVRLRQDKTTNSSFATSTLTISAGPQTTLGSYAITVLAQSVKISHSAVVNLLVAPPSDFSLTLNPNSLTIPLGGTGSSFYTLVSLSGFSGTVTITPSNIPAGVGVGIQTPPVLGPGANFTGSLFFNADNNTLPGTYSIVFTGQGGGISHTAILALTIFVSPPDFTIAATPNFVSVPQGSTGLVLILLTSVGGFHANVSLTSGVIPIISGGPTITLNQSIVFLAAGSMRSVELRIHTTATTPSGLYNFTATGSSGSLTHTAVGAFSVTISPPPDFSISANPTSLALSQGSSSQVFLNLTSLNQFAGTINLNATVAPTGPRLGLGAPSVTLNTGGTTQVALGVFLNSTVPPPSGTYLITVTGASGSLRHSVNIQLAVISSTPNIVLVSFLFQPTNVTLQLQNQGGGPVSLTSYQAGDSLGDNWTRTGWSGPILGPNATGVANVQIGTSCPSCTYTGVVGRFAMFTAGNTYVVTIIGSTGQAFQFTLTYPSGTREALSLDSFSFFSGTNVTLFLRNFGNVSVSLVSYQVKDAAGDQYSLTTWLGPTIQPGQGFPAQILIGSSCPSCTLIGNPFTFTPGQNYTIVLVTSRNNQFSFTLTR